MHIYYAPGVPWNCGGRGRPGCDRGGQGDSAAVGWHTVTSATSRTRRVCSPSSSGTCRIPRSSSGPPRSTAAWSRCCCGAFPSCGSCAAVSIRRAGRTATSCGRPSGRRAAHPRERGRRQRGGAAGVLDEGHREALWILRHRGYLCGRGGQRTAWMSASRGCSGIAVCFHTGNGLPGESGEGQNPRAPTAFAPDGTLVSGPPRTERGDAFLQANGLEQGKFISLLSRLRFTPYHLIRKTPP